MHDPAEIQNLANQIEKHVSVFLEQIENQKKVILARAREDALMEIHNAKKVSKEIIDKTIQQTQKHFEALKDKSLGSSAAGTNPFILKRSLHHLNLYLKEMNEFQQLGKNEPKLEFW